MEPPVSCDLTEFVGPSVDDRLAVEVIKVGQDALFEFSFGGHPDMAQHRASHLGEEAFDKIEPRAVFGGKHQGEAPLRPGRQPGVGFLRICAE